MERPCRGQIMKSLKSRVSNNRLDTHFYNIIDKMLILIIFLLVFTFILYPILAVIHKSFFPNGSFSLDLYKDILVNNKKLLKNSLFVASLSTVFSTLIALCISIYTSFSKHKIKNLVMFVLILSMISPPFISSLAYIQLFGKRGFITHTLLKLTLNPYGWKGIVIMQSLSMASLSSLMLIGSINSIDKNLLNASRDLGSDSNFALINILLPLMRPSLIVCALLSFVKSLSDFGTPMVIGGSFNVLATEIYMRIIAYSALEYASALNVLILVPSLLLFIAYRFYMKRSSNLTKASGRSSYEDLDIKIKGIPYYFITLVTFMFLIMTLLQYTSIFLSSISKFSYGKFQWTLDHIKYLRVYNSSSFIRSIVYSLIAGIFGTLLGILIAYYVERRHIIGTKTLDFISTLPYIIPGTFFGIGYILAFNNYPLELTGTAAIVVLNCIFKQLPMTTKTSSSSLSLINSDIERSAKDLGASNFHVLKDVIFPNMKSAFAIGFMNNFTSTMTTIGAIIFLIYPGQKVATVDLFDAINSGNMGVASVISSIIILITLGINIVVSKFILGRSVVKSVSSIKGAN